MFTTESYYTETRHARGLGTYVNKPVEVLIKTILTKNEVELKEVYRNGKLHHYEIHADGEFFSKNDELMGAQFTFSVLAG